MPPPIPRAMPPSDRSPLTASVQVLAANEAFYEAFRQRDMAAMEALWAQHAPVTCIHPGWEALVGRADVISSFRALLSGRAKTLTWCLQPTAHVAGEAAFVVCVESFREVELMATNVFVREDGLWKLTHHHSGQLVNRYDPAHRSRVAVPASAAPDSPPTSSRMVPAAIHRRALGALAEPPAATFSPEPEFLLNARVSSAADASEAAFAYDALRVSESHHRAILDNMLSALFTLTDSGRIETTNPAAEGMFGFEAAELRDRPFAALFALPGVTTSGLLAAAVGRATEWKGTRKTGESFPCELRLFPLQSLRGKGYGAVVHDLSERHEVERIKGELISIVSHELRTPLTALRGAIGLLVGGVLGELPEGPMELLTIAERNTLRLITLVNDILDLDRLQRGMLDLRLERVSAARIVQRSIEAVRTFADQEGIALEVAGAEGAVLGDESRLVQVLVNLLSNAIKFSPPGSRVTVSAAVSGAAVLFRVVDRGRGVPAEHRSLIFERFHQVQSGDTRDKGGTGLGLAISRSLVQQHGGSIGVEGDEGEPGATFWFRIPNADGENSAQDDGIRG